MNHAVLNQKKRHNDSVTEIVGTLILLGIAVALFSVLYFLVFSFPSIPPTPSANIAFSLDETNITIIHNGGKPLTLDTDIRILVNNKLYNESEVQDYLNNSEKIDDYWGPGEAFTLNFSIDMIAYPVQVMVIDVHTNSIVMMADLFNTNRPPEISSPNPANLASNVRPDIYHLRVTIFDPDGDEIDWTIEIPNATSNNTWHIVGNEIYWNISLLNETTDYIWYVNATDPNGTGQWTRRVYTFSTGLHAPDLDTSVNTITSEPEDTLDITATGDDLLDNVTLYYRWSRYDNWDNIWGMNNDTVENAVSAVDGDPDIGVETDFVNAQDTIPGTDVMIIQEENIGSAIINEILIVNGVTSDYTSWPRFGSTPYLNADGDGNHVSGLTNAQQTGWYSFQDTTYLGTTATVTLYVDFDAGDGDDDCMWNIDWNNDGTVDASGMFNNPTTNIMSAVVTGLGTFTEINNARLRLDYISTSGKGTMTVDYAYLNVQGTNPPSYRIDFEYQWTNAVYDREVENLSIYVSQKTGTENLIVNYWDEDSWEQLGTIQNTGWFNTTATGLTSSTYTIQLIDSNENGDTIQDSWDIDCIFLQTYNISNNPDNCDWIKWQNTLNPDIESNPEWNWTFDFPNDTGFYEFYSIGAYNDDYENPPLVGGIITADARCEKI